MNLELQIMSCSINCNWKWVRWTHNPLKNKF